MTTLLAEHALISGTCGQTPRTCESAYGTWLVPFGRRDCRGLIDQLSDLQTAFEIFHRKPECDGEMIGGAIGSMTRTHVMRAIKLVLDPLLHGPERGYDSPS